jgi:hypothetical protein
MKSGKKLLDCPKCKYVQLWTNNKLYCKKYKQFVSKYDSCTAGQLRKVEKG